MLIQMLQNSHKQMERGHRLLENNLTSIVLFVHAFSVFRCEDEFAISSTPYE